MTFALLDRPTATPEILDDLTRRELIGGGLAALLLASCSRTARVTAGEGTAGAGWSFTDDRGERVDLPSRPVRIAMQEDVAGALLPFGIRPMAVFGNAPLAASPQFEGEQLAGIEEFGVEYGVINFEKLAALRPDVILTPWSKPDDTSWMGFEDQGQLKLALEVAPVVAIKVTERSYSDLIERFAQLAEALGADLSNPEVDRMREEFTAAREQLRAGAAAKPGLTVLAASPSADLLYAHGPGFNSELLEYQALGLNILGSPAEGFEEVSWERIGEREADVILLDGRFSDGGALVDFAFLESHPIWRGLPAVEAGQVGKWYVGTMYRMPFFTERLQDLAALITRSQDVT